ncbi:hypothetical protein F4779DRAFT_614978 [Xylariaceae sp. FL0662B]|nr:hypothetical protein F4779DRAFT_614978 [Xylariaceae sp. FL0662B]
MPMVDPRLWHSALLPTPLLLQTRVVFGAPTVLSSHRCFFPFDGHQPGRPGQPGLMLVISLLLQVLYGLPKCVKHEIPGRLSPCPPATLGFLEQECGNGGSTGWPETLINGCTAQSLAANPNLNYWSAPMAKCGQPATGPAFRAMGFEKMLGRDQWSMREVDGCCYYYYFYYHYYDEELRMWHEV